MSRLGSAELFRRERQLLDSEEQPYRKGQRGKDAVLPERQERTMAIGQLDRRSGGIPPDIHGVFAEVEERNRAQEKDEKDRDRQQGHDHRHGEGQLDATRVEPDKHDVAGDPPDRLEGGWRLENRGEVGADEEDDHRRREHIFDILGNTGDEAAPRSERRAGKRIGPASMRQCRAHLGDGIGQTEIHDRDDDGADEHAAPSTHGEAEVPTREISRDDRRDAKRPK